MGFAHGKVMPYHSAVHSLGKNAGMNIWLPMPFTKRAKITLTNEGQKDVPLFYQIDYTIGDKHPRDVGRLHVLFRRENPTTMKQDFVLLPTANQQRPLHRRRHRHTESAPRPVVGRRRDKDLYGWRHGLSHHLRHGQ